MIVIYGCAKFWSSSCWTYMFAEPPVDIVLRTFAVWPSCIGRSNCYRWIEDIAKVRERERERPKWIHAQIIAFFRHFSRDSGKLLRNEIIRCVFCVTEPKTGQKFLPLSFTRRLKRQRKNDFLFHKFSYSLSTFSSILINFPLNIFKRRGTKTHTPTHNFQLIQSHLLICGVEYGKRKTSLFVHFALQ